MTCTIGPGWLVKQKWYRSSISHVHVNPSWTAMAVHAGQVLQWAEFLALVQTSKAFCFSVDWVALRFKRKSVDLPLEFMFK